MRESTSISSKQILALQSKSIIAPDESGSGVGGAKLLDMLRSLPQIRRGDDVSLIQRLENQFPNTHYSANEFYTLSFVDGCLADFLRQSLLDSYLSWCFYRFAPVIAMQAVAKGPARLLQPSKILAPLDLLCKYGIGWSADLGILGKYYVEKVELLIEDNCYDAQAQQQQTASLKEYFQGEHKRSVERELFFTRAEQRKLEELSASDTATRLMNAEMLGHKFPFFIVIMLQGGWVDFLHYVLLEKGMESKQWQMAKSLTAMLVWSFRGENFENSSNRAKLNKIIEKLPAKIRQLDQQVNPLGQRAENVLADIEAEYDAIVDGKPSECGDFTPIDLNSINLMGELEDAHEIKEKVQLKTGDWFCYDELDKESARLKLILIWKDTQLLFTNQNHKGAFSVAYTDFCESILTGKVRKLSAAPESHVMVHNYIERLIHEQRERKVAIAAEKSHTQKAHAEQVAEAKRLLSASGEDLSELNLADRKAALLNEMELIRKVELKEQKELNRQQRVVEEKELAELKRVTDAKEAVLAMGKGTEIRYKDAAGDVVECKLLTRMVSLDKYIFVNKNGVKVAEFNHNELADMRLSDELEITKEGEVFEDTLASVVRGLREDRDKAYVEEGS